MSKTLFSNFHAIVSDPHWRATLKLSMHTVRILGIIKSLQTCKNLKCHISSSHLFIQFILSKTPTDKAKKNWYQKNTTFHRIPVMRLEKKY